MILDRPLINMFQAVISTYHMKMKFPGRDLVWEVRCEQYSARRCYYEALKLRGRINVVEIDQRKHERTDEIGREEEKLIRIDPEDKTEPQIAPTEG